MLVTIISDASYCQTTKCGGYGIWVASRRGSKAFGGAAHGFGNSTIVECVAVANGLHHAITSGLVYKNDAILFQTDCKAAIQLFEGTRNPKPEEVDIFKWFMDAICDNGLSFQMRHVKGHTNLKDSRSLAQDKCDETAGRYMRAGRRRKEYERMKSDTAQSNKPRKEKTSTVDHASWVRKLKLLVRQHTKVEF